MRLGVGILVGLCLFVLFPAGAHAAPIYLDAKFSDWNGKACLTDGLNDTIADTNDISYWYFTTNDGESRLYVMVQRFMDNTASKSVAVYYTIFIDTNDNGVWDEPEDGVAFADYYPGGGGLVSERVFRGGSLIRSYQGYWGEKANRGGARCEFYVDFADITIQPGQPIRLILFARTLRDDLGAPSPMTTYEAEAASRNADRCPDMGDLQWAPVSALGRGGFVVLLLAGLGLAVYGNKGLSKGRLGGR